MPAPTVRDSTAKTASNSTTCVADTPVGTTSGDLLIVLFDCNNVTANIGTLTLPSGWTLLRRDDHSDGGIFFSQHIAYKTAGGSEPSTYTFTAPAVSWWRMAVVGLVGATAIEANQLTYTASTIATQIPCPSVTTLGADRLLLYFALKLSNLDNGQVPPGGWTELEDFKNTAISNGSVSVGYETQAVAGASGTFIVTATSAGAGTPAAGYTLSVSPAAGTGGGWTIQQITHCSVSLLCSDSLPNRSIATALGEADPTIAASIVKQARKTTQATAVVTTATISRQAAKTVQVTAATTATITKQIGKGLGAAPTVAATIVKRAGKALAGTPVTTGGSLTPLYLHAGVTNPQTLSAAVSSAASLGATYIRNPVTTPRALTATVVTTASLSAVKVTPVIPGTDSQDVSALVAAVGGGVGY